MIETKEKVIGARTYLVSALPAFKALDVLEKLTSAAGPAMAALAAGGQEAKVEVAAAALFARMSGGKLRELAGDLLASVAVVEDGKRRDMLKGFDVEYAGRLFEVMQVMAFAVEVSFGDFFAGLRDLLSGALPAVTANGSSSPTT